MIRRIPILVGLLLLLAPACSPHRNRPSKPGADVEGQAPVAIYADIQDTVRAVKHTSNPTPDGRQGIQVVLENRRDSDIAVIAQTTFMDATGRVVEQSVQRSLIIPKGGTVVYEDTSFAPAPLRFNVAVRPASTKRKR